MSGEHWWNNNGRGKTEVLVEILSHCQFLNNKSHKDWPGIESWSPQCRATNNRLWYGTALSTYLAEAFPCFFLSCKANFVVKLAKMGHGPHSYQLVVICVFLLLFVLFCCYLCFLCYLCCSMSCSCVNVYCTTVTVCQPNCS